MKKNYLKKILISLLIVCFSSTTVFGISIDSNKWIYNKNGKTISNIRDIAKQSPTGYNVLQGSCNDGNGNFYFTFMKKSNEKIKVVKMRYENGKFVRCSAKLVDGFYHGNDMTYVPDVGGISGNDKILITNNNGGSYTNHIAVFDVATMKLEGEIVSKYWKHCGDCQLYVKGKLIEPVIEFDASGNPIEVDEEYCLEDYIDEHHGFSTLAYNKESGKLVSGLTSCHDVLVFDFKYKNGTYSMKPISYIVQSRKESTFQGIDCDSDYIYMTWSAGNGYSGNRLCVYDWVGKKKKEFTIDNTYEIESISHVGQTFYAGYHHSFIHKWVTKEKKKVKWKKVWNKAHTKKVWKYKTKTIKKNHSQLERNAYIKEIKMAS